MGILIDTVRICNYRSLKNIEVKLSPISLLVGMNNSGKTSFLRSLQLALGVEKRFVSKDDFFIGKEPQNQVKEILIDILIVPVDDKYQRQQAFDPNWASEQFGSDLLRLDENDNQYVAFRTKVFFDEIKNDFIIQRFQLSEWPPKEGWEKVEVRHPLKKRFESIPLFFIDAQRDIFDDLKDRSSYLGKLVSKIEFSPTEIEKIEKQLEALNLSVVETSPVLSHLKKRLEQLNNTISNNRKGVEITPFTKKLRDVNKGLNIHFQDNESESFPIEYHGLGTRSWASLLTFNAFISWRLKKAWEENDSPFHPVLALEEPEAHLHPDAQRHIYSQLKQTEGQKIISTHSPFIAGQCKLEEILHFFKKKDYAVVNTIDLSDISDEDRRKIEREIMNTRGELLFARAVILAEGETEEQALPVFAREYWGQYPFELGLHFIGVGGNSKYLPFLKLLNSLNIEWFILSDGEDRTVENLKKQFKIINHDRDVEIDKMENVFIYEKGKKFESYLIDQGYQEELISAIDKVEGENYFESFIEKKNEKEGKRVKTGEKCEKCGQFIYKNRKYDYKGDKCIERALLDCLDEGKTRYSPYIAEAITGLPDEKRRFPTMIKNLLDGIDKIIQCKKSTGDNA
ncbi:MAG: AAA family ATPase [Candidatus Aminicenantes bacterium]|nr:AAA family ATPase [Candidatus Aminicenantes bacterium]